MHDVAAVVSRRVLLAAATALVVAGCASPGRGLPRRIVGGYWPAWPADAVRLRDVPAAYNVVYLFAAVPAGTDGRVVWNPPGDLRGARTHLIEDIGRLRVQGRSVILSVGGAGAAIDFDSRAKARRFLESLHRIVADLGEIDGVDFNTFEGGVEPAFAEYAWLSGELKSSYGDDFAITAPPAPWSEPDRAFCSRMVDSGLLDFCAPQFYDGPGLARREAVVASIGEWIDLVDADHLGVGFGLGSAAANFMTPAECAATWRAVDATHAGLRGAYVWSLAADEQTGWEFSTRVGPLL